MAQTAADTTSSKAAPRKRRRWPWYVLAALLVVVAAAAGAFCYVTSDAFVREQVIALGRDALNGDVTIESAHLDPLGALTVNGIRVTGAPTMQGPGAVMIEAKSVRVEFRPLSALESKFEVSRMVVEGPRINVVRLPDGKVNFDLLLRRHEGEPGPPPPVRLFPGGIIIHDATVTYTDPTSLGDEQPRVAEGVNIQIWPQDNLLRDMSFSCHITRGPLQGVSFTGWRKIYPDDRPLDLHLAIHLPAVTLDHGIAPLLPAGLREAIKDMAMAGIFSGNCDLTVGAKGTHYSGSLAVSNLSFHNTVVPLPVEFLATQIYFDNDHVQSGPWVAQVADGSAVGAFRLVDLQSDKPRFWASLTVNQGELNRIGTQLGAEFSKMRGPFNLTSEMSGGLNSGKSLKGSFRFTSHDARLGELPVIVGLLNVFSLRMPGKPIFDLGRTTVEVADGKVHMKELLLSSPGVEITARGTVDFNGQTDMIAVVASSKRPSEGWLPVRLVKSAVLLVVGGLEQTLLPPVHISGPISKPNYSVMAWEPLKAPLREITRVFDFLPIPGRSAAEEKPKDEK